jgi:hypothetical protein
VATPLATPQPTPAGFSTFVYGVVGVPVAWLPTDSVVITYAYNTALATVNPAFRCVPGPIFLQMVYNLGAHLLLSWAPDTTASPPFPFTTVDNVEYGFFEWYRKQNNMLGFTTGIVQSASDEGTSTSMVVPDQAKNLTISQLGLLSTPFGRYYLGQAQAYNSPWGLS